MKKEEVSKKMKREECEKCGSHKHKTSEHRKGSAMGGGDKGDVIEGVQGKGQHFKGEDDFTPKDIKKEKQGWRKKNSNLEKGGDWNT